MKITELIKELERINKNNWDLDVYVQDTDSTFQDIWLNKYFNPWDNDMIYFEDEEEKNEYIEDDYNWLESVTKKERKEFIKEQTFLLIEWN